MDFKNSCFWKIPEKKFFELLLLSIVLKTITQNSESFIKHYMKFTIENSKLSSTKKSQKMISKIQNRRPLEFGVPRIQNYRYHSQSREHPLS